MRRYSQAAAESLSNARRVSIALEGGELMKRRRGTHKAIKDALKRLGVPQGGAPGNECSFCGKKEHEVEKLIAGPSVFICNECVRKCAETLGELGIH